MDLNADVGEVDDARLDAALLEVVTSASVACGFHAGDPVRMGATVAAAAARGVVVGAHPSYPDRPGFGRRPLDRPPGLVAADVLYQVGALAALAAAAGTAVRYVKPHGALYHRLIDDVACATAVVEALGRAGDLALLVAPGSVALEVAARAGVRAVAEGFADRAYLPDGRLAPRRAPGSVITDPGAVARQAVLLARHGAVVATDGSTVEVRAASICVHGDTPGSEGLARAVREALAGAGVVVAPFVP